MTVLHSAPATAQPIFLRTYRQIENNDEMINFIYPLPLKRTITLDRRAL